MFAVSPAGYQGLREYAVRALGKIDGPRAAESVTSVLLNDVWPVQVAAAKALGNIADERAVEPLSGRRLRAGKMGGLLRTES
jgi:HEAT repeat protein